MISAERLLELRCVVEDDPSEDVETRTDLLALIDEAISLRSMEVRQALLAGAAAITGTRFLATHPQAAILRRLGGQTT